METSAASDILTTVCLDVAGPDAKILHVMIPGSDVDMGGCRHAAHELEQQIEWTYIRYYQKYDFLHVFYKTFKLK